MIGLEAHITEQENSIRNLKEVGIAFMIMYKF